jgi:hypothetical protein
VYDEIDSPELSTERRHRLVDRDTITDVDDARSHPAGRITELNSGGTERIRRNIDEPER